MGQGQSSANREQEDAPAKADYYELLGIERTATDDEIKKAYRRKALELHPDRNYGNIENATRLFAEIQSAYEVLSDPQERAWYDSHRDVLLRGEQAAGAGDEFSYNIRMTSADEVSKLMLKFNGRLDYSDAPSGFYGGLQDFFKQLAREEDIACQWEDQEPLDYPEFGLKEDNYENVVRPFYAAWSGFATRKSYSWKDHYRLSDAPDRRVRRLMEKENKKLREDAIQEYNDAVRSLVAFVRKRDPRVQKNQKTEAERQKMLRDASAAQAARSRAARLAQLGELDKTVIPEWARSRAQDEHEGAFSSESEREEHQYECVVCDKIFKSEAQFHAHEKSKKHIKLLKQLKREMRTEGTALELEEEDTERRATPPPPPTAEDEPQDVRIEKALDRTTLTDTESEEQSQQDRLSPAANGHVSATVEGLESSDASDDDYAPRSKVEKRLGKQEGDDELNLADVALEGTPPSDTEDVGQQPKIGKAKQRRAKKAAQKAATEADQSARDFRCTVCQAEFASKTKLFNHIKERGHAAPISQVKGPGGKGGKGKKR